MKKTLIVTALLVVAAAVFLTLRPLDPQADPYGEIESDVGTQLAAPSARESVSSDGFLFGRVTTPGGASHEGRLRFGRHEEAFWSDYFNGYKADNPWAAHVPHEQLTERRSIGLFGVELFQRDVEIELGRPFMVRFGDVARIDVDGGDLRVTLKSGTVFDLDRFNADDVADGLRVWDRERGVVDLAEWQIRSIEFLASPKLDAVPARLFGTVRTRHGLFTGFVQWNRESCVGTDRLVGRTPEGDTNLTFDTIRSIARGPSGNALVTRLDGSELELSGTPATGEGHRGVLVDDERVGRVLLPWDTFERIEFGALLHTGSQSGPAYDDFAPGRPLTGSVITQDGRHLAGRLVYDLDESETTETLDAPSRGVNYTVPFGRIASIEPTGGSAMAVTLRGGEELRLERAGDLGDDNAGLLVFPDGDGPAEYVPWRDVVRIDFDR